jgi:hypothetical protein
VTRRARNDSKRLRNFFPIHRIAYTRMSFHHTFDGYALRICRNGSIGRTS